MPRQMPSRAEPRRVVGRGKGVTALLFFFVVAYGDGGFAVWRAPTLESCQENQRTAERAYGEQFTRLPIGVSECAKQ